MTAVREFLDAANRRDYEVVLAAIHPEVQWHSPPDIPNPEVARGRDEYVAMWRDWLDAWDDYRFTPDEIWGGPGRNGRRVRCRVRARERQRHRCPARRITGVYEVRDRKIVRFKAYLDRHEALEAAGVRE